jgi:hypothetical protein
MDVRKVIPFATIACALTATACGKHDEIPEKMRGSYKVPRFVLGNVTVVVEAKQLRTPDCKVNCGVETLPLTDIKCEPVINPTSCSYKSEHCTGKIEMGTDGKLSISADAVPGATGEGVAKRNYTCGQISGNDLERVN